MNKCSHNLIEVSTKEGSHMSFKCGCGKTKSLSLNTNTSQSIREECLSCKGKIEDVYNCKGKVKLKYSNKEGTCPIFKFKPKGE
jgi:hypothetical protein